MEARNVINGFNVGPVILAVISLILDFCISVYKLFGYISEKMDKRLTAAEIILIFLFVPLAFSFSDFDYSECVATGLSDSIMESLDSYSKLGLTMLIWIGVIIGAMVLILLVCWKDSENKEGLLKLGLIILFVILLVYAILALLFLVLAFMGTLISLLTGLAMGIGGIVEFIILCQAFREEQDVSSKVGLGA